MLPRDPLWGGKKVCISTLPVSSMAHMQDKVDIQRLEQVFNQHFIVVMNLDTKGEKKEVWIGQHEIYKFISPPPRKKCHMISLETHLSVEGLEFIKEHK